MSLGKYTISCLGGDEDILGSLPWYMGVVEMNLILRALGAVREVCVRSRVVSWRVGSIVMENGIRLWADVGYIGDGRCMHYADYRSLYVLTMML